MYLFCISCKEIVATIKVPTLVFCTDCSFVPYSPTSSAYAVSLMCRPISHLHIKQANFSSTCNKICIFVQPMAKKENSLRNGSRRLIQFTSNYQRLLVCLNNPNGIFQRKVEKQWRYSIALFENTLKRK